MKLAGLKWNASYGCFFAHINGWLRLSFAYEHGVYVCKIDDKQLRDGSCKTQLEAAERLKAEAVDLLKETLYVLENAK